MKKRLIAGIFALLLTAAFTCTGHALSLSPVELLDFPLYDEIDVNAKACIVMEATTGRVLCGKNIHERLPQASTTKIMGAMMVLEQENLQEYFTVDPDAIHVEGSSMGLREGDQVSLYALACGMILPSGNDAANAAGVRLYGSVEGFVEEMNKRSKLLGLEDTHYVTACGLDAPGHYSSAFDLAKLTRVALCNPDFAEICSQPSMKVSFGAPPYERWLKNYNKLLTLYPPCIGVKTGFTDDAGKCLVSAAQQDGMTLICVTLNCPDEWTVHQRLYEDCFSQFSMESLPACPRGVPAVGGGFQKNGYEKILSLVPAWEAKVPLKAGESSRLRTELLAPPFCYLPANPYSVLAREACFLSDQLLCSLPLVADAS